MVKHAHQIVSSRLLACTLVFVACAHHVEHPPAPLPSMTRYRWNGYACVPFQTWQPKDEFVTVAECTDHFSSCPATPKLTDVRSHGYYQIQLDGGVYQSVPGNAFELQGDLWTFREPTHSDADFLGVSFSTFEPLTDDERETLRCYGVLIASEFGSGSGHETVYFTGVPFRALGPFLLLPFFERIEKEEMHEGVLIN